MQVVFKYKGKTYTAPTEMLKCNAAVLPDRLVVRAVGGWRRNTDAVYKPKGIRIDTDEFVDSNYELAEIAEQVSAVVASEVVSEG